MKRTMISLGVISVFILGIAIGDLWFMNRYAAGMNEGLDAIAAAESFDEKKMHTAQLEDFFVSQDFWAHRLIPTSRLEELETLLHKLNAYLETEDENEVSATVAEIKARVNLLYSTNLYHWYHPAGFSIE